MGYTDQYIKLVLGQAGTRAQNLRDIAAISANRDQTIATANARAQVANAETWSKLPMQLATIGNATARTYLEDKQAKAENEVKQRLATVAERRAAETELHNRNMEGATLTAAQAKVKEDEAKRYQELAQNAAGHMISAAELGSQSRQKYVENLPANRVSLEILRRAHPGMFDQVELPDEPTPETLAMLDRVVAAAKSSKKAQDPYSLQPGGVRYSGDNQQVASVPAIPRQATPLAPPQIGTEGDYLITYAQSKGKTAADLTPGEKEDALRRYRDATTRPPASAAAAGATEPDVSGLLAADPASSEILGQTGLPLNAFMWLTGRGTTLPRDAATRNKASREAQEFARKRGVDVSTMAAQYKAYNDVLGANITRLNNTKMMEGELDGTVENIKKVATDSDLSKLRFANVVKIWAGQEVNDNLAQQYALHLGQLRNELSAYYAATQGRTGNNITLQDQNDAANVIKNGVSTGSLDGLAAAIKNSTQKMGVVMEGSVDRARKGVWSLFGVGENYKNTASSGGPKVGDVVTVKGKQYTVGKVYPDGTWDPK